VVPPRTAPLRYAKDAWSIQKGKKWNECTYY
jgi:hypothetical protein